MTPTGKRNLFKRLARNPRAGVRLARAKLSARWVKATEASKRTLQKLSSWWNAERPKKLFKKQFFANPINFIAIGGQRVSLFRHGLANSHGFKMKEYARPVVFTLVNGRLLQFYKSTGTSQRAPKGKWVPFEGLVTVRSQDGKIHAEEFTKFPDHPNFVQWIENISEQIAIAEKKGQIELHEDWDAQTYNDINKFFKKRYIGG